jgi:hypothetical protein
VMTFVPTIERKGFFLAESTELFKKNHSTKISNTTRIFLACWCKSKVLNSKIGLASWLATVADVGCFSLRIGLVSEDES